MENDICVFEKRFNKFDLLFCENENFKNLHKVTDVFFSKNKREFKSIIESISIKRMEYVNFWKEYVKSDILAIYDEIIERYLDIEKEIRFLDEDFCFIVRKNDCILNYLNNVDLDIELYRVSKSNWDFIEKKFDELYFRLEKKIDILENKTRLNEYVLKYKLISINLKNEINANYM